MGSFKHYFQTNDPLVLQESFKGIMLSETVATSKLGSPSKYNYYLLDDEVGIVEGECECIMGRWCCTDRMLLTISNTGGVYSINGVELADKLNPMISAMCVPGVEYHSAMPVKTETVAISVSQKRFEHIYGLMTQRYFVDDFPSSFITFRSDEARSHCANKIAHLMRIIEMCGDQLSAYERSKLADFAVEAYVEAIDKTPACLDKTRSRVVAFQGFEYMLNHVDATISMKDLSRVTNAPSRTIQQGFKEAFGMGAIECHRTFRLFKVREAIKNGDLGRKNLLSLAMEYGFFHAGRFSIQYKKLFGVSPSRDSLRVQDVHSVLVATI